jgi:hypothetical protein
MPNFSRKSRRFIIIRTHQRPQQLARTKRQHWRKSILVSGILMLRNEVGTYIAVNIAAFFEGRIFESFGASTV